jgi:hypothetical protein
MGSGAGTYSKASSNKTKTKSQIEMRYGIKPEKIIEKNGVYYCEIDRDELKISNEVLIALEKYNSFSKDIDEIFSKEVPKFSVTKTKN